MQYRRFRHACLVALLGAGAMGAPADARAQEATTSAPPADEAPFLAENHAAMDRMMADMAVKPTGDVDRRLRRR